jgi:xylan 1,4-beta-xylosidase
MGIANQLRNVDDGFRMIASFPELKNKPIVIGESDPEGCAACQGPQLAYRNGTMYSSYTAAVFTRKLDLAEKHGVNLEGALTWAFEFEDQPYFAGFRSLASNGLDKPVLNVFRMFSKMSGNRLKVESDGAIPLDDMIRAGVRGDSDVNALAAYDEKTKTLTAMVWNYHDDDVEGPAAKVSLLFPGIGRCTFERYLIDEEHSNAFTAWKKIGSPQSPTADQYKELEQAGQLQRIEDPGEHYSQISDTRMIFTLPRKAVTLVRLTIK